MLLPAWVETSLLEIVAGATSIKTMALLVVSAGLDEMLQDTDKALTIFAPIEEAFEDVDVEFLTANEDLSVLQNTLLYHMATDGPYPSMHFTSQPLPTVQGAPLKLALNRAGQWRIYGGTPISSAGLTKHDALLANNGIVHFVDSLLQPPALE